MEEFLQENGFPIFGGKVDDANFKLWLILATILKLYIRLLIFCCVCLFVFLEWYFTSGVQISKQNSFRKVCFWCWLHTCMDPPLDQLWKYGRSWPLTASVRTLGVNFSLNVNSLYELNFISKQRDWPWLFLVKTHLNQLQRQCKIHVHIYKSKETAKSPQIAEIMYIL